MSKITFPQKLIGFLIFLFLFLGAVRITVVIADKYSVDGDFVYIEDSRALIEVYPKDITGDCIDVRFISKQYSGDLDIVLGYDSNLAIPYKVELYGIWENSFRVDDKYFDDPNYMYNNSGKTLFLWSKYYFNEDIQEYEYTDEWNIVHIQEFDRVSLPDRTIYWDSSYYKEIDSIKTLDVNYDDFNRWYYGKINVESGKEYKFRVYMDIVPTLDSYSGKYGIGFKPSNLSVKDAVSQDNFYYLDPWYNSDWGTRMNFTIGSATGAGSGYTIRLKIYNTTGSNSGNTVYIGSNVQTDWGDLRFTDDDGQTLLDYWIQETFSNYAWVWVEENDDLSSTDQVVCMYYNSSTTKTTTSDISTTFDFGDDFDDNDISDWSKDGDTGQISVSNGEVYINDPVTSTGIRRSTASDPLRFLWRMKASGEGYINGRFWDSGLTQTDAIGWASWHTGAYIGWHDGAAWQSDTAASYNSWHHVIYVVEDDSVDDSDLWVNYGSKSDIDRKTTNTWSYIVLNIGAANDRDGWYDWVAYDYYVDPEPSVDSWENAETQPIPPTPTVTTGIALLIACVAFIIGLLGLRK